MHAQLDHAVHWGHRRETQSDSPAALLGDILGVPSKNIAGKSNLAPQRPRAAPIAPMGRHNRSGGQIFNGIVFGGDVGTIYMIFPLQSMHCEP